MLLPLIIEIVIAQPALQSLLPIVPFPIQDREPGRISVPSFHNHVLPKQTLKRKAQS